MKIRAQYTFRDYLHAQRLHRASWLKFILTLAYLGWVIHLNWPDLTSLRLSDVAALHLPHGSFAWLALAGLIGLYAVSYLRQYQHFRENTLLQRTREVEITPEEIVLIGSHSPLKIAWGEFCKSRSDKNVTLFYQMEDLFQFLPRRWFTDAQFAEFQNIAKTSGRLPH